MPDVRVGIALYEALYRRFFFYLAKLGFEQCVVIDGDLARVDFCMAMQLDHNIGLAVESWQEWQDFNGWLISAGKPAMQLYSLARQFSTLANEYQLFSIQRVVQQRSHLPSLTEDAVNHDVFVEVVLNGHNHGLVPANNERLLLIQGLEMKEGIELGQLGALVSSNDLNIDLRRLQPYLKLGDYPYSAFVTTDPQFNERPAMVALMAALRTYRCGRPGDIKYVGFVQKYRILTGEVTYITPAHSVTYQEETALFGSEAPTISKFGLPSKHRLPKHIAGVFETYKCNLFAAEMLSRALLAPQILEDKPSFQCA
ncbi:hypothetical protein [Ruegeria arenilitoris]|uniref:hypothetical protein n=1 Tax=Ruegeria arenilitoris TaxID=1173585 RepID=UPI00147B73BF|nr:hypothetical protein [Ruegeria arenilitoris]